MTPRLITFVEGRLVEVESATNQRVAEMPAERAADAEP